eukprot:5617868-Prymnesium_polylepis.2
MAVPHPHTVRCPQSPSPPHTVTREVGALTPSPLPGSPMARPRRPLTGVGVCVDPSVRAGPSPMRLVRAWRPMGRVRPVRSCPLGSVRVGSVSVRGCGWDRGGDWFTPPPRIKQPTLDPSDC